MLTQTPQSETQKIPKLRFPGFFGGWAEKKLGEEFIKIRNGFVGIATPHYVSDGVPYLQGKNIKDGQIILDGLIHISKAFHDRQKNSQLKDGDVLMVQSGHAGECAVVDNRFSNGNCHALLVMTPRKDRIDPYFVKDTFYSGTGKKIVCKITTGNTIQHILASDAGKIKINLPSLPEQQKIAGFLGSVDEWIENLIAQKESFESYKKGMTQKIFSQEIRFKDEKGNEFPEWEDKVLGNMLSMVIDNRGKTPPIESSGVSLLEVNSLGERFVNYLKVSKYVNEKTYKNWFRKYLQPNDVLFSTVGATALCSFYNGDQQAVVAQNIVGLRFKTENPNFMYYLLTEKKNNHKFKRIEMGAVQPSVKVSQMIKIKFLIPSVLEQEKIADFLTSIDTLIESKQQQITQAEQWKKGLMQGLFV